MPSCFFIRWAEAFGTRPLELQAYFLVETGLCPSEFDKLSYDEAFAILKLLRKRVESVHGR